MFGKRRLGHLVLVALVAGAAWSLLTRDRMDVAPSPALAAAAPHAPHVVAASPEDAGRYIALTAGCVECHTPNYMMLHGKVAESEWLTGSPLGWRGPWGTTYASNLRLVASTMPAEAWVAMIRARNERPPMPWYNVHHMSDADLTAVHRYLVKLGVAGTPMPAPLPPDAEPPGPYFDLTVKNLPQ